MEKGTRIVILTTGQAGTVVDSEWIGGNADDPFAQETFSVHPDDAPDDLFFSFGRVALILESEFTGYGDEADLSPAGEQ